MEIFALAASMLAICFSLAAMLRKRSATVHVQFFVCQKEAEEDADWWKRPAGEED